MTEKKITKRERFEQIKALVKDNVELVAFCDHEIELLAKKNASRNGAKTLTKAQQENEVLKAKILESMELNKDYTITEMLKTFDWVDETITNQKMSALVTQLKKMENAPIVKTELKGKAYFRKVVA